MRAIPLWRNSRPSDLLAQLAVLAAGLAFALFLVIAGTAASAAPDDATPTRPSAYRVIDGDTIAVRATEEHIRLANIDTPERGERAHCDAERQAAERATRAARSLFQNAQAIEPVRVGRLDRYGRTIAFVHIDGRDMGEIMIEGGYARPWRGRREAWCGAGGELLR